MRNSKQCLQVSGSLIGILLSGCLPTKARSIAEKDIQELRLPKATLLRYLGRSAPKPDDERPAPARDPFLTEEEDQNEMHPPPPPPPPSDPPGTGQGPVAGGGHGPVPPPEIVPPRNPPSSVAGLLVGKNPMFFFKDDTYGVGDKFMGEWVVDKVTEERASMHWVKDKAVRASMNFSRSMQFEIRKS